MSTGTMALWTVVALVVALVLVGIAIFALKIRKIFAEGAAEDSERDRRMETLGLTPLRDRIFSEIDGGKRPVSDHRLIDVAIDLYADLSAQAAQAKGSGQAAVLEPADDLARQACRELAADGKLVDRDGRFTLP